MEKIMKRYNLVIINVYTRLIELKTVRLLNFVRI